MSAHHDQTFALARLLEDRGSALRWTSAAPTEAWLLGLGGGVGVQVFTFDYQGHLPHLYVGTRCAHQYAYDAGFLTRIAEGLGLTVVKRETGSKKLAATQLEEALDQGPVLAWVGREALRGTSAPMGATPWVVLVTGIEGGHARIEDVRLGVMELPLADLATARAACKKQRHRLLSVQGELASDPRAGIEAGLRHQLAELQGAHIVKGYANNFGLAALEKWAKAATGKAKGSWPRLFSPGARLFSGVKQAWFWIELSTGGGAFRPLLAEFLREAAAHLDEEALHELAALADANGLAWTALADRLLDPKLPVLAEARRRMLASEEPLNPDIVADLLEAAEAQCAGEWAEALYPELESRLRSLLTGERAFADRLSTLLAP